MSENESKSPQAFISYSWSSTEHEAWVLNLATELVESGVEVVLDKWDLREGADKFAFMERMVTDPNIRKVVVICDRLYAEKADDRQGGVGTETQIISKEVYDQVDAAGQEQKFVAVTTENDEKGEPYVPTFLKSRIYIDMSAEALRAENFEKLVRWIYDKPLYKRPERGKPPAYLLAEDKISLGTSARFRQAVEAVRQDKASAPGAVRDYFNTFAENLENLRIEPEVGKEFDDQVIESIDAFLPYRDELVDLFLAIAQYRSDAELYEAIHAFFERILPYGFWPAGRPAWNGWNADNFKFVLYELFLYMTAALLKNNRFETIDVLVGQGYYFPPGSPEMALGGLVQFTWFRNYLKSLEYRNKRLEGGRRLSLMADLIKDRAKRSDLTFEDMMQADFVLFIRDQLTPGEGSYSYHRWYPNTLLYATDRYQPFEIFTRAQSSKYFGRIKTALGVSHKNDLVKLLEQYQSGQRQPPRWDVFRELDPAQLIDVEKIASRP